MSNDMSTRPPVGFIVEGAGEYTCYPSLFCRIADIQAVHIPIVNAGGCGTIIRRVDEQINDLLIAYKPLSVIITVDLEDVIKQGLAISAEDLMQNLNQSISIWREYAKDNPRLDPLPNNIKVVIQIRKFETWLLSDLEGLKKEGLLRKETKKISDAEEIVKPSEWIKKNLKLDVKKPIIAKQVIAALRPDKMRLHSKSFNQFYEESTVAYKYWLEHINN